MVGDYVAVVRPEDAGALARLDAKTISRIGVNNLADLLSEWSVRDMALRGKLVGLIRNAKFPTPANQLSPELTKAEQGKVVPTFIVGSSSAMTNLFDAVRRYAPTEAPILILGETGTGKELVARAMHERSQYHAGPFVAINCGALPSTLIGSELFGYEKGAFTGAVSRKIGRIELAQNGTIFLDEIGDLPLEMQAHLLRFLQEKTIDRIGGHGEVSVDTRVIAATNIDLAEAVAQKRFREDLYYRLNVLTLVIPPLRERGEDILLLARFFLSRFSRELHDSGSDALQLSREAEQCVISHQWPGNVRELITCMRRAVVMAEGPIVEAKHFGLSDRKQGAADAISRLTKARDRVEIDVVKQTLERHHFNVSQAASELGVSRVTLYRMLHKHGIPRGSL
ncbi:MAG: sigma-54 interaction domain-containing protein [Stellaceae bacterium]